MCRTIRIGCAGAKRLMVVACIHFAVLAAPSAVVFAQSKNLAPGFEALPKNARVVVMPADIELFSISAGGVLEPRADWTEAASKHFSAALLKKKGTMGLATVEMSEKDADDLAEISALHAAVARSISIHHFGGDSFRLPTKGGKLDWSLGDAVNAVKQKSGADYGIFIWIRDSYASSERTAAIIAFALLGVGLSGGIQVGYASLVDLTSGRVLWFNRLLRMSGDLREADKAAETLDALLDGFPGSK